MGRLFRTMLAGRGDDIALPPQHFGAHVVPLRHAALGRGLLPPRIQVFALALEAQIKRQVVDAGAEVSDLCLGHAQIVRQLFGSALHAVAESGRANACGRA